MVSSSDFLCARVFPARRTLDAVAFARTIGLGRAPSRRISRSAVSRPAVFALLLLWSFGAVYAQTCVQVPQRVTDSTGSSNSLAGWAVANGDNGGSPPTTWTTGALGFNAAQHWDDQTNGTVNATVPTGFDTMTQTVTRVSGGALLQFDYAWNNAQYGGAPNVYDGNQARLVVSYNGVIYVEALTATFTNRPNTNANAGDAGPTGGAAVNALNGATLVSGAVPAPFRAANGASPNFATIVIRLPDNVAQTGPLVIGAQRMENGEPQGRTDDFYVRNVTLTDTSLCIVKNTPVGAGGTFNFATTNLDDNLVTAGNQSTFSLVTSTATPSVALDTDTGTAGNQPALYAGASNPGGVVTIQETAPLPTGYAMTGVSCDQGVTGSVASNQATLTALPAGVMTTCTLINRPPTITFVKQVNNNRLLPGDQWTVQIQNSGGTSLASGTTSGTGTTATTGTFIATAGTAYTLAESGSNPLNFAVYNRNLVCTNAFSGGTPNSSLPSGAGTAAGGTATWPAITPVAGDTITCTVTNTGIAALGATIILRKQINSRRVNTDQFTVQVQQPAGTLVGTAGTTSGTGTTASTSTVSATAGTTYTLTEIGASGANLGNYNTTIDCSASVVAASGTTLPSGSGQSFTVTPQNGDKIDCTLNNTPKPKVTATKSASANPLLVGASGQTYTIAVTIANGPTAAPITIADALPTGITLSGTPTVFPIATALTGCPSSGGSLTGCTLVTNLANGIYTITVPINVAAAAVGASGGNNSANLSGGGDPLCTSATGEACDPSTPTTAVSNPPNVTVTKAFSPNPIAGGGTSTLTITIANTAAGAVALTGVSLTDSLPAGMTVAASPAATTTCNTAGGATVSAALGGTSASLSGGSVGANATCTITVPVTAP